VNDYWLNDSTWKAPLFEFHGMTVDCIDNHQPSSEGRKKSHNADITYGTITNLVLIILEIMARIRQMT
jgi:preprotein translocase subunit SecA